MKLPGHTISKCIDGINYGIQLCAIKTFLSHSDKFLTEFEAEVAGAEKHCDGSDMSASFIVEKYFEGVYWDASMSMAAIGQFAPFLESLFTAFFRQYGKQTTRAPTNERFSCARTVSYDPHFVFAKDSSRKDFIQGIFQLVDSCGLTGKMPEKFEETIKCTFTYRNKMFHNGLEWPKDESAKFSKFLQDNRISLEWFDVATSSDSPWCYFMTTGLITHLLSFSEKILQTLCEILDDIQPDIEPFADTLLHSIETKDESQ
jgi:hypothetical protein